MSAGERAMAGHCEDADLSALNGLAPHLISRNEKTLDGAFLEIDELRETVDFLKRELEALKHGR